jgi:hypothetical protein
MDYEELTATIIHRDRGEQDATELYVIPATSFENFDPSAISDEFADLLNHDKATPWIHDGYTIDEHRRRVESGASGYLWELVVEAWEAVPAAVIGYGLRVTLDRLADQLGVLDVPPLDRDRALNTARWAVLKETRSLQGKELGEPVSEGHDAERHHWIFTFHPGNGYEYAVDVGWHSRVPGVVRMVRTQVDPRASRLAIVSGSIVKRPGVDGTWVVVDITGDGLAVLRRPEDIESGELVAVLVIELELVGHLEHLDGWIEESHGVWRKI